MFGQLKNPHTQQPILAAMVKSRCRSWPNLHRCLDLLLWVAIVAVLSGCALAPKPQKGGSSRAASSNFTNWYEFTQGENAATASSQQITREETARTVLPPGSQMIVPAPAGSTNPPAVVTTTAPTPVEVVKKETITTQLGAAQKDTARELGVKLAAVRPAIWAGILCVIAAGVFVYLKWPTPALIAGATGAGLMLFAQAVATHTALLLVLAVGAVVIVLIMRAYDRGQLDKVLPPNLDRFPQETKEP